MIGVDKGYLMFVTGVIEKRLISLDRNHPQGRTEIIEVEEY